MKEEFENFFGIIVGKFVWWKYLMFWVILHIFFGLLFVSDFKEELNAKN